MERFVEKPDAETAAAYLAEGAYRWNAGMFVSRADVLLDLLAQFRPGLPPAWRPSPPPGTPTAATPSSPRSGHLEKVAIDYAVAEPAAAAAGSPSCRPPSAGTTSATSPRSPTSSPRPRAARAAAPAGVRGLPRLGARGRRHVLSAHSGGFVVPSSGRVIAVIGLEDVVVVDTPDAVLVTTRAHAQAVKAIVDRLKAEGRHELT